MIAENASTEMTMLIELDSDNRAPLRRLFDGYPCLHGVVAAVSQLYRDGAEVAAGAVARAPAATASPPVAEDCG